MGHGCSASGGGTDGCCSPYGRPPDSRDLVINGGKPRGADEHLTRAAELHGEATDDEPGPIYGQDITASICAYHALALWHLGFPDQAFRRADDAFDRANRLQHANTSGYVCFHVGWLYGLARRFDEMDDLGRRLVEIAEENQLELWGVIGRLFFSWRLLVEAPNAEALGQFKEMVANYQTTQMGLLMPMFSALLAAGHGKEGDAEYGISIADEARAHMETSGERIHEAELYRVWGDLEDLRGDQRQAEAQFQHAIDIARAQSAKSWELRAATCLARLWHSQSKTIEARNLLAPVYGWFTEGFDTADLKEAKALLEELS